MAEDGLEAFLRKLAEKEGIVLEEQEAASSHVYIRLMIARGFDNQYISHCFLMGKGVTTDSLEGELLRGQWTIRARSLTEFAGYYSVTLENNGIRYHRDPSESLQVTNGYAKVSFKLLNHDDDKEGKLMLSNLQELHKYIHENAGEIFGA
ncbi:MAG: hypothetical protein V1702_04880 [Candidatus Woesearchaeota archaeon]